jgi:hypothetical protein
VRRDISPRLDRAVSREERDLRRVLFGASVRSAALEQESLMSQAERFNYRYDRADL